MGKAVHVSWNIDLISLNKKYPDIHVHSYNDFAIRGVVII